MTEIEFVTQPTARLVNALASDDDVAMAAWVSFDANNEDRLKDRDKVAGLINFLGRENHTSPFEHGYFKFLIDCPLFVAREFHRHRTFSYNEVSGRYTKMQPRFYVPSSVRPVVQKGKTGNYHFEQDGTLNENHGWIIREASETAWKQYEYLLEIGIAKEVARMHLPLNLMTQFYASVDPLNLMKFLDLRSSEQALYEIRDVAEQMEEHFEDQMPLTFAAWKKRNQRWKDFLEYQRRKDEEEKGIYLASMGTSITSGPPPHFELRRNIPNSTGPHLHFQTGGFISGDGSAEIVNLKANDSIIPMNQARKFFNLRREDG